MRFRYSSMILALAAVGLTAQPPGVRHELVHLQAQDGGRPMGLYQTPEGTPRPKVAFVLMHPRHETFLHFALEPLARKGYGALGLMPRNPEHSHEHEHLLLDLAEGVRFVKSRGAERVILIGHSGGGSLSVYYQSQAEATPAARIKTTPAGDPTGFDKYDLPRVDGIVLLNAAEGEGLHIGHRLDPSVTDESNPFSLDPALDVYSPENGFRVPPQPSKYPADFLARYRKGQQERARRLVEIAQGYVREQNYYRDLMKAPGFKSLTLSQQLAIQRRAAFEPPMTVYRSFAEPGYYDLSIDPNDRTLGHYTAPRVDGQKRSDLYNWESGERMQCLSPRAFLSTESIVSHADLWSNLRKISAPVYVVNSSADSGIWPSEGQKAFDVAASKDKEKLYILGGEHSLQPEGPKGGKGDQRQQFVDAVAAWTTKRWSL